MSATYGAENVRMACYVYKINLIVVKAKDTVFNIF